MEISADDVATARARIAPYLLKTPLVRSDHLKVWLKLETQQPTGAFKVRPAFNGLIAHLDEARAKGVIASSSGNFAQAVAYAARTFGVSAQIVMPSHTSPYKIERTRLFGGEVVLSEPSFEARWELTHKLQRETGRVLLHPYDSLETIAGDATLAEELLEQLPGNFRVVVGGSGGGMLAGISAVLKRARPGCRVVGVQPAGNGSLSRSFQAGKLVKAESIATIADALTASAPGENTFSLIRRFVDEVVNVEEDEIRTAVRTLALEQKLVVEPGGAVGVAALLAGKLGPWAGDTICILSGGNIEPAKFAAMIVS